MLKKRNIGIVDYDISVKGGVEQVTCSMANALTSDFEVFVVSYGKQNFDIPYEFEPDVKVHALLNKEVRLRDVLINCYSPFRKYIKENKIELVIFMGAYAASTGMVLTKGLKIKTIFFDHGALMNQWNEKNVRFMRKYTSKKANKTVTLTERTRMDYLDKFKTKPENILCLYNWIDDKVMEAAGIYNKESKKIISVGRISKEKGFDLLLQVAKDVLDECSEWSWDIYGDGPQKEEIQSKSIELGLQNRLNFLGQRLDVIEKYKDYGIFVLTSYREGMPLVLLEARANSLPIVSFDIVTGPGEIVEDGMDGYLIEPYDTDQMAKKIIQLIQDKELRNGMSKVSENNIEKFLKKEIIFKWIQLIHSCLN